MKAARILGPWFHMLVAFKHLLERILIIGQIRSLSRLIWINVSVPPADDSTKGKGPNANLTSTQLRRRKVDALKLCAAFAFSVKHYLRGEDGLEWEDYAGIIPASTAHLAKNGYDSRKTSTYVSYSATAQTSLSNSGTGTPDENQTQEVRSDSADATKRIRVKRSKDKLKQPGTRTPKTPLLSTLHQTIDFNAHPEQLSTPLPLV